MLKARVCVNRLQRLWMYCISLIVCIVLLFSFFLLYLVANKGAVCVLMCENTSYVRFSTNRNSGDAID